MSSDEGEYERVDLYPADSDPEEEDWETSLNLNDLPAIHAAIYNPNLTVEEVEAMVIAHPPSLESVEPQFGHTPLHCAAKRCSMPLIKMLVDHGAVVDTRGAGGETPLMVACGTGNLYVVHTLCEFGADLGLVDKSEQSPLHYAAREGAVHILQYLSVRGGLNFRATDSLGNTPLHYAAMHHKIDTVAYLLRHKRCDLRAPNNEGFTAVHYAAKQGSIEMCWILLNKTLGRKKDPLKQRDKNGLTPLEIAKRGLKDDHKLLARRLQSWAAAPDYMSLVPWGWWVFFSLLGGLTLLLTLLAFTYFHQPVGLVIALIIGTLGFFLPLSMHRIPHPAGWPNPLMLGALVTGVGVTCLIYLFRIFFVVWPDYAVSFIILTANSITAQLLFFKLWLADPGIDKVGQLGKDRTPLTIVDVARQVSPSGDRFDRQEKDNNGSKLFCTKCEIVISDFAKHCKLCDSCCLGFDHHCMWLTRCVGYNTHRYFVVFLMCIVLDSVLFIYHAFAMMGKVGGDSSVWGMLSVGFTDQTAAMMLLLCNFVAFVFAVLNTGQQLLQISRLETTYFDSEGRGAYKAKRQGPGYPLLMRVKLVVLFFTNYPLWFTRRPYTKQTLTV